MQHGLRRLPLRGLINCRDLGGYPTRDGKVTRFGAAVRSEAPWGIPDEDLKTLREYGITTVVDLRGGDELTRHPSRLEGLDWAEFHCCPAFDESVAIGAKGQSPFVEDFDMGEKYVEMADHLKNWVARVMTVIAQSSGGVLFNCAMGKDRTGIIAALLLGNAGVYEEDIVADYMVSDLYLRPIYERMWADMRQGMSEEQLQKIMPYFLTPAKNMQRLLSHLNAAYGGVTDYLKACGLDEDTLRRLRARLVAE